MTDGDGAPFLDAARDLAATVAAHVEGDERAGPRWPHVGQDGRSCYPADIYSGQAGVALFLGTLAALDVDRSASHGALARRALAEAWRSALERAWVTPAAMCGEGGLLWVEAALARLRPDDEDARRRVAVGLDALLARGRTTANELFYGAAGAIVTWLSTHSLTGHPAALAAAEACGEQLERSALQRPDRSGRFWRWGKMSPLGGLEDPTVYVGLSHGPAGIAYALLELAVATGEERFAALGRAGLAFVLERGTTDVDRFGGTVYPIHDDPRSRTITYWCHGAAGIAIALLHAARLDEEQRPRWRAAADDALAATDHFLTTRTVRAAGQCHGVAGLIEAFIEAGLVTGERRHLDRARELARVHLLPRGKRDGHDRLVFPAETPPPGVGVGLGQAGVGLALLRLAVPERVVHHALVIAPGSALADS